MYINEPALKGNRKKPHTTSKIINQYEFSSPKQKQKNNEANDKKSSQASSKRKMQAIISPTVAKSNDFQQRVKNKDYKDQIGFENDLIQELGELIQKWEQNLNTIRKQLKGFDAVNENQTEIKAFQHCVALLDSQFDQSQTIHENARGLIDKKVLQVDEIKLRLLHDIDKLKNENKQIAQQNQKILQEQKQRQKKRIHKKAMQDKLHQQKQKMQKMKSSLAQNKKKSYQQKSQFIELQTEQFRLESQIRKIDEQEQKIEEEIIRYKKYEELCKIKEKVLNSHQNIQEEARPHLQRKIDKMARLRSQTQNIDEVLQVCIQKIEDQNIIIQALKEKSYHQEAYYSDEPNQYQMYLKKYQDLYFGDQSSKASWNDYNTYLKHLLERNKNYNERVYSEMPSVGQKKYSMNDLDRKKLRLYTQGNNTGSQVLDLRPSIKKRNNRETQDKFGNNSTKISNNPEKYRNNQTSNREPGSTKLPKLVKLQGRAGQQRNMKDNAKKGIIKNSNKQQDFSLESIRSNDSRISGEIIEVEFHKR